MESLKEADVNSSASSHGVGGGGPRSVVIKLPLGVAAATFDLEKAVCSHGFSMMAPNHWDPLSKTFQRPFRLDSDDDDHASVSSSFIVQISQPSDTTQFLLLRVFATDSLSPHDQQSLMGQVRRMLRLSEVEERNVREFHELYGQAKGRGFGRVFRSPTLFEDMVKCILLCNCQWSRTLSMARALCELQSELQCSLSNISVANGASPSTFRGQIANTEHFVPKTPAGKESKRKIGMQKSSRSITSYIEEVKAETEGNTSFRTDCAGMSNGLYETEKLSPGLLLSNKEGVFCNQCDYSYSSIGNFPSTRELASLDQNFLETRCKLGYRASRILSLARGVVEGRIQLRQLEEACEKASLSNYSKLAEKLKEIDGFGPFTCANVLMCMGYYHVVPSDSETIRHLKQVHGRKSSIKRVQQDIELIYGKYAPFQFLVYWSEVWSFYEEKFGKMSELPQSHYKLFTAANMRCKKGGESKRIKIS